MNAVTEVRAAHPNVYVALAAAQAAMGPLIKGSVNPAFKSKYADLADLTSAVREPFATNGLAFFHQMVLGDRDVMRTVLVHGASDTRIECDVPLIVDRNNMQGMKSATTYAKRIGLESVAGIAPEDDDGNAAPKPPQPAPIAPIIDALKQAREDAVNDSLPDNATPRQKAEAFAQAIMADFKAVTGQRALEARWARSADWLDRLQASFPDLYEAVGDAYEARLIDIEGDSK